MKRFNLFPNHHLYLSMYFQNMCYLHYSLIVSYINYGLLLWGVDCHKLQSLQKKAKRFMTNSSYIAHTVPLLIRHGLLHVHDMFRLKLLKFYYKLSYDLLPPYFITYSESDFSRIASPLYTCSISQTCIF